MISSSLASSAGSHNFLNERPGIAHPPDPGQNMHLRAQSITDPCPLTERLFVQSPGILLSLSCCVSRTMDVGQCTCLAAIRSLVRGA